MKKLMFRTCGYQDNVITPVVVEMDEKRAVLKDIGKWRKVVGHDYQYHDILRYAWDRVRERSGEDHVVLRIRQTDGMFRRYGAEHLEKAEEIVAKFFHRYPTD